MEYTRNRKPLHVAIGAKTLVAVLTVVFGLIIAGQPALAQSYNVIYNFTGGSDGATPYAGVTLDRAGNLYGTASDGFNSCRGTVFELTHGRGGWTFSPLYHFPGNGSGGCTPLARVVFGSGGALYGTTYAGGAQGTGTVFQLLPPVHVCTTPSCQWSENLLYSFGNPNEDGAFPGYGDLVFDHQGNIYGTTIEGGGGLCNDQTCGTVYKLTPSQGAWTEAIINDCCAYGYWPYAGVVFDNSGNLYGTAAWGGGSVYELSPQGSGWSSKGLYFFLGYSEGWPEGGVILDSTGNLYGTTAGGTGAAGSVFQLVPSNGGTALTVLHSFGRFGGNTPPGPSANLLMDTAGNLYGTTYLVGAHSNGMVFKLTPSNGSWTFTDLYDFTGGADGGQPWGQLSMDANGDIYGTTTVGGTHNAGVVFEITP